MATWTQAEIDFIANNPELSYLGVAEALGRTRASVKRKVERTREIRLATGKPGAMPGEAHHKAVLTEERVRDMRDRYACRGKYEGAPHISILDLSIEYGVANATCHGAVSGRTWRHVV